MRYRSIFPGVALTLACALALPAVSHVDSAHAQKKKADRAKGEVMIILAKEEKGEIDEELKSIKALRRPPFNTFRSMKLLSKPKVGLEVNKDKDVKLPNKRVVRVRLLRKMPDGRFQVQVSINRPGKKDYLPLLKVVAAPGDPFFVAGQAYKGGTLVVGISLLDA